MQDLDFIKKQLKRCKGKKEMHKFLKAYQSKEGKMVKALFAQKPEENDNWQPLRRPVESIKSILREE